MSQKLQLFSSLDQCPESPPFSTWLPDSKILISLALPNCPHLRHNAFTHNFQSFPFLGSGSLSLSSGTQWFFRGPSGGTFTCSFHLYLDSALPPASPLFGPPQDKLYTRWESSSSSLLGVFPSSRGKPLPIAIHQVSLSLPTLDWYPAMLLAALSIV